MSNRRYIGETVYEAVNWAQDLLRTTRPIAENTVLSAIAAKMISWDDGVYIFEDDEEFEKRKRVSVQNTTNSQNKIKRWTRIHFRNHNRSSSKNSLNSVIHQAASKFSDAAEDMMNEKP